MRYNGLESVLMDAVTVELDEFQINNVSGSVSITADIQIPIQLPDEWEFEDGGDEFATATIHREFML